MLGDLINLDVSKTVAPLLLSHMYSALTNIAGLIPY